MDINNDNRDDVLDVLAEDNLETGSSKSIEKTIKEYAISIAICVIIAIIIKTFVVARADVEGRSMFPTLKEKDVLFINRISSFSKNYKRGEIVIFESHNAHDDIFIKRVIAVAGDEIEIRDNKVYLNGQELQEDYLPKDTITEPGTFMGLNEKYKVPEGYIFVMGDNRSESDDSRNFGPVSLDQVQGKAFMRVFPLKDFKFF